MSNILKEEDLQLILDSEIMDVVDLLKYPDYFYLVSMKSFSFYIREIRTDQKTRLRHFIIYHYDNEFESNPYKFFTFSSVMATTIERNLCEAIYTRCENYLKDQFKKKCDQEFQELRSKVEQGLNELRKNK